MPRKTSKATAHHPGHVVGHYFPLQYDPLVANLTAAEMERYLYAMPFSAMPEAQQYLEALRIATDVDALVDYAQQELDLDCSDIDELRDEIKRLYETNQQAAERTEHVKELLANFVDTAEQLASDVETALAAND